MDMVLASAHRCRAGAAHQREVAVQQEGVGGQACNPDSV
jgi:hypothetical protein